ncbi:hypothetical protein [Actinomadura sp. DC4]|nr:hypothetical protein [Actinomadura sp. DC4]MDN3350994.1 hypothetical protein [Actinomadura sp. DC4]
MLCYTAEYDGTVAIAVFAVAPRHYLPEEVLVEGSTESTLLVSA